MKILPALLLIVGLSLSPVARGETLETFDAKQGFSEMWAIQAGSDGMTQFIITLNPAVFLSHFRHGFPADRKTEVRIRLVCNNDEHFKGPSVELGTVSSEITKHRIDFDLPSADLGRYHLDFLCSIPPIDEVPVIGGEFYQASLKDIREAKEAITEESPVWKEMVAMRDRATGSKDGGGHSFGGGSGHAGRAVEPAEK